jgi:succinate dehydrogenase / fumarate reductase cytochrome b subunit
MGLWLVIFLFEHMLTNSQAALLLGENGKGFVTMVNFLHDLPYLEVVEIVLIGVPILVHAIWGVLYALKAKSNVMPFRKKEPSLPQYCHNQGFAWMRITAWIMLVGLIGHVTLFRFVDYPLILNQGEQSSYFAKLSVDDGLYTVAQRLGVKLYSKEDIQKEEALLEKRRSEEALVETAEKVREWDLSPVPFQAQREELFTSAQDYRQAQDFVAMLTKRPIDETHVIAVAKNFGTASLLTVRTTFKSPLYAALYTIFVLATCFHAGNGFWTFLLTWGVTLRFIAQKRAYLVAFAVMLLLAFLGLVSIWGTYFVNLRY